MNSFSQNACDNTYPWPQLGWIGIQKGDLNPVKPLHIFGKEECPDPAIRLQYFITQQNTWWGHLALVTPGNIGVYSTKASLKDLVLQADDNAEDIILTTRNQEGAIRFCTTNPSGSPPSEQEVVTILNLGQVGILNPTPKEALQILDKLTFHVGASYNFISYNEYVDGSNVRRRIFGGIPTFTLNFDFVGNHPYTVSLGNAGIGNPEEPVSYDEENGGYKGLTIQNPMGKATIGIGSLPWQENNTRLFVRGLGTDNTTYALRVTNNTGSPILSMRDDNRVGIRNDEPKDICQIGSSFVFHDGGSKVLAINAYTYEETPGVWKWSNFEGNRASFLISAPLGDNEGVSLAIDKLATTGEVFVNGFEKGIHFKSNGDIGVGTRYPSARLHINSEGNDNTTFALKVQNNASTQLLVVRDDGNVGIGFSNPEQKLAVNGKVRIGTQTIVSGNHTDYMLSVDGKIVGKELIITLDNWGDFVFDKNYSLPSIEFIENFIAKNGHLPNIPSEADIIQNGLNVGEMQKLLMQKIEELTLYIIELKKEINNLKQQIKEEEK